jgi:hypothetical protein
MDLDSLWRLLHHFFSFGFVGTLVVAEWNGRASRATNDWGQRALLFQTIHLSTRVAGIGSLVLLGVFGHLLAVSAGYRMGTDVWLRWVTGLWMAAIAVMAFFVLPAAARLAAITAVAAVGGEPTGYDAARGRWRMGNVVLTLLYLTLLALMVFRRPG